MNIVRSRINDALEAMIEEKNGFAFQRLALQVLHTRWPSLASVAEQSDLGEDAVTIHGETSDGVTRSFASSLTATWRKLSTDARRIAEQGSDPSELVFATPKSVTRKTQMKWESRIKDEHGWRLIIVERSEFLAILERPDSQWLCSQHLGLSLGHLRQLESAEALRDAGEIGAALRNAGEARQGALSSGDWMTLCRTQLLLSELYLERAGICAECRDASLEALSTAREHGLTSLLAECLARHANSIMGKEPGSARDLLEEAEGVIGENPVVARWILLIRAELECMLGNLSEAQEALSSWDESAGGNRRVDRQSYHHMAFRLAVRCGDHSVALDSLSRALRRAREKKRWASVGWMLHEKARYLAQQGDLQRAAREAEKAMKTFENIELERGILESAMLSGHLHMERRNAERALALADYLLSMVNPSKDDDMHQGSLQLRTKALQTLGRIKEAQDTNAEFRRVAAHKPQALLVADLQDAMLLAESGEYSRAEALILACLDRACKLQVADEIVAAIKVHWAHVKMDLAQYREARTLAEDALGFSDRLPDSVRHDASHIASVAKARAPLTSVLEDLVNHPSPLEIAGTGDAKTIRQAHQELVLPLLDWIDAWPRAAQGIYDCWGRGNLARYVLNHRGFESAFHVAVEATTVNEARAWARALCPLTDVLTILWKGPILDEGMILVPARRDEIGVGGWGYSLALGDQMRPDQDTDDWDWSPAIGLATLLPEDAVRFLFEESRDLFQAGRLFLLPALHVGCIDPGHGPVERMFNDITNASPVLSSQGGNGQSSDLASLPLPFFPDVPLSELARVIAGEEESLLRTRLELREWARTLGDPESFETRSARQECYERVEVALRGVEREFRCLVRRLPWTQTEATLRSHVFEATAFEAEPVGLAGHELAALHGDLRSSPWYAYFRLSSQGYCWDLLKRPSKVRAKLPSTELPERVHHWLVPPTAGWMIPAIYVGPEAASRTSPGPDPNP